MSGVIEVGRCKICGAEDVPLTRKYYYYNIQCECCGCKHDGKDVHFEFVAHCKDCEPHPPREIRVLLNGRKYLINE